MVVLSSYINVPVLPAGVDILLYSRSKIAGFYGTFRAGASNGFLGSIRDKRFEVPKMFGMIPTLDFFLSAAPDLVDLAPGQA